MTLEQVLNYAKQLSAVDKIRLIQQLAAEVEQELVAIPPVRRKSLWGLCADLGDAPSAEDIDSSRVTG